MYDLRQFKPTLYVLLLLGMTGYALATQSPGLWAFSLILVLLNAWLVKTNRFVPLPRLVATALTLLGLLYAVHEITRQHQQSIFAIGKFLVILQIVKLYEQRANRDYAQLLVLSLLLMVAAAISTGSLLFGVLLVVYLFISLYCCLLFHLKTETEQARASFPIPPEKVSPATLRQDERFLTRSMRRLTTLVAVVSITMAVLVFVFFPRGSGAGILGQVQMQSAQSLTGFSDQINFQQVARISQNQQQVAFVTVSKDGIDIQGTQTLYLRGVTLDTYGRNDLFRGGTWQWSRTPGGSTLHPLSRGSTAVLTPSAPGPTWRQHILLNPTGTDVLFALHAPTNFTPAQDYRGQLRFSRSDQTIGLADSGPQAVEYDVSSQTILGQTSEIGWISRSEQALASSLLGPLVPPARSRIDPRIAAYARRPEVSGVEASLRSPAVVVDALDEQIARNIERHLRTTFRYTLDLTDAREIRRQDPVCAFLYDLKRGHCEYFAGAMTLLCQSLGMQARVVVGFKCDEYNTLASHYVVRQSHAHAWVEVFTSGGWKTFDPTSGNMEPRAAAGLWRQFRQLMDYIEFKWQTSVVAYNMESRENLIGSLSTSVEQSAHTGSETASQLWSTVLDSWWTISSSFLAILIALALLALFIAVGWFLLEKWKLRRRAARMGIDLLPNSEQLRLARQLGFYDDLMRLLERRDIRRPPHLTPMEFASSLSFLPSQTYDTIRRLTHLFYRIRFGRVQLTMPQRRRLARIIHRIDHSLSPRDQSPSAHH